MDLRTIQAPDTENTRARIVEAAGRVFAERGFEGATVREICQLANANLAAINYYFGDKSKLYLEAVRRAHQWRVELASLPVWKSGTPAQTRLTDFIRTLLTRMLAGGETTWHTQLMMREMSRHDSACGELVIDYIRPQFELLKEILSELAPSDMPEEKLHLVAFSVVGQCLYYRVAAPVVKLLIPTEEYERLDIERLTRHIADFTLAAVGRRPEVSAREKRK